MKQQYLRLFSFLIGVTFIISGILFTVVNNYKDEKREKIKKEQEIADEIGNVYATFYDKEKELSEYRDTLLKDINDFSVFYTEMPDGYGAVFSKVGKYETMISEIDDISSYLKGVCTKRYSVLEANDKCEAYYINLEKTINIFIGDLEYFNSKIKSFNEWTVTENESLIKTRTYDKLAEYTAKKYTDYVDLNNDETFLGRNNE